jgi:hypothetical protein
MGACSMKPRLVLAVLLFGSVGVLACSGTVVSPGGGGSGSGSTTGTSTTGTGAGSTSGGTTTGETCPTECSSVGGCPQGSYCFSQDPCGTTTTCMTLPPACAATPTCACLMAGSTTSEVSCYSGPGGLYVVALNGDSPCCP